MSVLDLEQFLSPVADDDPAGKNLEYEPDWAQMELAAAGKPERQIGERVDPAEPPDWREVKRRGLQLLERTRDVRVGVLLAQAMASTDGLEGLASGLELVHGFLERFWDTVHPRLDPPDDDPVMRVNALQALAAFDPTLRAVRDARLVQSRIGAFSYRDVLVARGRLAAPPETEPPGAEVLDAAFRDAPAGELQACASFADRAAEAARAIEELVAGKVGAARAPDLGPLRAMLDGIRQCLAEPMARHAEAGVSDSGAAGPGPALAVPGEVASRQDAVRLLDRVCEYFERCEPSSPVPLLLRRAQRLVNKNFMDIVRDLAPDGLSQVERIRGEEE
ncbi:MAG: type VI secretion system protein TssA [Acidobacteria bacterium]|nr:type VI secretion system protein TssA [Acidobacteriota bacterium]